MTIETLKAAREAITGGNYYKSILLDKLLDLILIEDLVNPDSLVMPFLLCDPTAGIFASQEKNADKIIEADFLLKQDACVAGLPMIEIAMGALCAALDRQSDLPRISIEHHERWHLYKLHTTQWLASHAHRHTDRSGRSHTNRRAHHAQSHATHVWRSDNDA